MRRKYVPERGDVAWLNFTPQSGHEQADHRPALVLSPQVYNQKTGLMLCCPITSQAKGYPFEVQIEGNLKVSGVVLSDQIKSLDWQARKAVYRASVSSEVVKEVLGKIKTLLR